MARPKRLTEKTEEERTQEEKQMRKLGRVQFYIVLVLFVVVIVIMELVSRALGKTAGTIALCVMTAGIAVWLYHEEILDFLKRKK